VDEVIFRINDVFFTIQGEGANSGRRALFIRLPYCNYNCPWCDTEFNSYNEWSLHELSDYFEKETCRFVVVTGGEPLMNKQLPQLISFLKSHNFEIAIESNGSFPAPEGIDFITVSPKKYVQKGLPEFFINPALIGKVNEYKYVVEDGFDFNILKRHQNDSCRLSLSPEFNNFKDSCNKIINYIKENPRWKISLQTHKFLNIP